MESDSTDDSWLTYSEVSELEALDIYGTKKES